MEFFFIYFGGKLIPIRRKQRMENPILLCRANSMEIPLADKSVQCVVTSPPYWGLRDYGVSGQLGLERTPDEYVANMVAVFREVRRVLKDDGCIFVNLGDSYNAAGRNGHGTRIGYKQGTNRASANGNDSNRPSCFDLKPKDLIGIPWRVAFALQADGWYLRQDIIWHKPNPMPESVRDRCTKAHEYLFLLTKSERYYWDADAIRVPTTAPIVKEKRSGMRSSDLATMGLTRGKSNPSCSHPKGANRRSVWTIPSQPFSGAHFATFPFALVEPCILAASKHGDIVFDPFGGSGSTGIVAERNGRKAVLLDLSEAYLRDVAIPRTEKERVKWQKD